MNNTAFDCTSLKIDWAFVTLTSIVLCMSLFTFIGNAFIFFVLTKSHSLPSSVNLFLKNAAVSICVLSAYGVGRCSYNYYILAKGFVPISRFWCAVSEAPTTIVLLAFTLSISAIGVDRLINTIWKTKYADLDRPSVLAYFMFAFVWLLGTATVGALTLVSYFDPASSTTMCFCSGVLSSPMFFSFVVCPSFILLEIFTVVCYLFVYKHSRSAYLNFSINTTQHSLGQRYQMMSNIKTTVLLMPTILIHGVTYVVLSVAVAYLVISNTNAKESMFAINYITAVFLASNIEALSHPILLLVRHEHLTKVASKYLPFLTYFLDDSNKKPNVNFGLPKNARLNDAGVAGASSNKPRLSILPTSNKINAGVVDFRLKPEQNNDLLKAIWNTKQGHARL